MGVEEYNHFIQFGKILNVKKRRKLVEYMFSMINEDSAPLITKEERGELKDYITTVDLTFKTEQVKNLCRDNEKIRKNVFERTLSICEESHYQTHFKGPFVEEEVRLRNWEKTTLKNFYKSIETLFEDVEDIYTEEDFNLSFFREEVKKVNLSSEKKKKHHEEALKKEILDRWESLLLQKKHVHFLNQLDEARKELCEELYKQIDQYEKMKKILSPFSKELGRLWDLSEGMWANVGFEILEKYAQLIEKQPEIQELAEYLGRMHEEESELEEKMIEETIIEHVYEVTHAGKSELVGIHESDDFNHLLPSELALLDNPTTETIFYLKLLEKKLLTYDLVGYDRRDYERDQSKTIKVPKDKKKGPIIICVDTSGSMHGTPEHVAKVLCFAVLRIALLEERSCYLISFSTRIKTLELTNFKDSIESLIDFLSHSFHGGTDASPALREAVRQIKTSKYEKADVLMISDFIMKRVAEDIEREIESSKVNGTRYHSLVISSSANPRALEIFDNNWIYNTRTQKPFQEILKNIRYIKSHS